jgi:protein-tyrosine phosphatase
VIDLHSHLLPGVDDGSRTVDQSVRVLLELAAQGLTDVCLTPHLKASQAGKGPPAAHDRAFDALAPAAPPLPRLHRGAEVMLDRPLTTSPEQLRRVTLGGTRYILVEFPRMVALDTVTNALSRVLDLGLIPVLAHPERYSCCSPESVTRWRSLGAVMQVDGPTLTTRQTRGQRARDLITHGLADIIAGDNHGDDRSMAQGQRFLLAQDAQEQAELLTRLNPGAILADGPLQPVPPIVIRTSWLQRIRGLLDRDE